MFGFLGWALAGSLVYLVFTNPCHAEQMFQQMVVLATWVARS